MRRTGWLVLVILLIAFALRLYHLGTQSLWLDELVTASYIYTHHMDMAVIEPYSLIYVWFVAPSALLIHSEFGLRFPFVLAGVLSTALIYQIGKQYHSQRAGLIASLLFSILPIAIYFAQEARLYGVVIAAALLTLWCIPLVERGVRWARPVYLIALALTAAVHLMTLPWLLTQVGVLGVRQRLTGKGMGWRMIISGFFAVIVGNGIIIMIGVARNFIAGSGAEWIPVPDVLIEIATFTLNAFGMAVHKATEDIFRLFLLLAVLLVTFIIVEIVRVLRQLSMLRSGEWAMGWSMLFLAVLSVLPVSAGFIVSRLLVPVWLMRYFMPSLLSLQLLTVIALASLPVRVLRIGLVAVLAACSLFILPKYFTDERYARENWRDAIGYLNETAASDDLIVLCPNFPITFEYYGASTLPDVSEQLALYNPPLSESDILKRLTETNRLWVLVRLSDCPPAEDGWPDSPVLDATAQRVEAREYNRLTIYEYRLAEP